MAELAGSWFEGIPNTVKKKRTFRPRPTETHSSVTTQDKSLSPLASPLDETTKLACDGSKGPIEKKISSVKIDGHRVNCGAQPIYGQFGTSDEGMKNVKVVKRVKVKVDGVTHTIRGTAAPNERSNGYSARDHPSSEDHRAGQKEIEKDVCTDSLNTSSGLQRTAWKDLPIEDFSVTKSIFSMGRPGKINPSKKDEKLEPVRKSKRAPNSRALDLAREDDEVDEEIRFLEKLRNTKSSTGHEEHEDDKESSKNHQKYSQISEISTVTGKCCEISKNMENGDEDVISSKSKEATTLADPERNAMLTARQRALLSGKRGPSSDANLDFPNGLQPVPLKKKKDNLSAKELLNKAEAAQKRRLQSEKVAQKSQEDAIRKILNQESSKKKKEDQTRKRLKALAEEKAAEALKHRSNTVRVVMSPTGTTVSFGENCIPSMFTSKPPSYPPPRENCAGPSCCNPYKYRDSKSRLPLCSLKCYKAVRERLDAESSC